MGDYTNMVGYYDCAKIVDSLVAHRPHRNVLEIAFGTGVILGELANRQPQLTITGIDKLLTNLLRLVSAAAIGEGLMLGAKAGIPLHTVW